LARQLLRPEVGKSLGISTPTSQQVQMEILVEKRQEFLTAGYVVFCTTVPVSQTRYFEKHFPAAGYPLVGVGGHCHIWAI